MTTVAIDHVIVVVDDLDDAAELLDRTHGLASLPGGRHRGHGTGNRIVPLGASYLELMAVVDPAEAAESPMGRWALDRRRPGLQPAGLCLRTDDADAEAARLGLTPQPMSRALPDGTALSWRLVGAAETFAGTGLPFFIQWDDMARYPGRTTAAHRAAASGITNVGLAGDAEAIARRIGSALAGVTITEGRPAIRSVTIATDRGDVELVLDL